VTILDALLDKLDVLSGISYKEGVEALAIRVSLRLTQQCHAFHLVSFPDQFSPYREKWFEWPIPFLFHTPECWWANQAAL